MGLPAFYDRFRYTPTEHVAGCFGEALWIPIRTEGRLFEHHRWFARGRPCTGFGGGAAILSSNADEPISGKVCFAAEVGLTDD